MLGFALEEVVDIPRIVPYDSNAHSSTVRCEVMKFPTRQPNCYYSPHHRHNIFVYASGSSFLNILNLIGSVWQTDNLSTGTKLSHDYSSFSG